MLILFVFFFPPVGVGGADDAEQEVLRRDCARRLLQEPQDPGGTRSAALHQGDQPQRQTQERGERVVMRIVKVGGQ